MSPPIPSFLKTSKEGGSIGVSLISDPHPTPTFTVTLPGGSRVPAWSPAHRAVIDTPEWQAHLGALRDARRAKGPPLCLRGGTVKTRLSF